MSALQDANLAYHEARDRFRRAHGAIHERVEGLTNNLLALKAAREEAAKAKTSFTLARQKLEQALHADASGVLGTPEVPTVSAMTKAEAELAAQ
jgi:hypothetical protein